MKKSQQWFDLKRSLDSYVRNHPDEGFNLAFTRLIMEHGQSAFSRGFPDHITASAFVFDENHAHVCMIWHEKLQRWLQPGGHFEDHDASVFAAARRELFEETGLGPHNIKAFGADILDIDLHPIGKGGCAHHFDVRYLFVTVGRPALLEQQPGKAQWRSASQILEVCDSSITRPVSKGLELLRQRAAGAVADPLTTGSGPSP